MKERLRTLMQIYSINQSELASKIGVSKMTISHIMSDSGRGGSFRQETIEAIKRAFPTIDINWLIHGVGTAPLPLDETSLFGQPGIANSMPRSEPELPATEPSNDPKQHYTAEEDTHLAPINAGNKANAPYSAPELEITPSTTASEGNTIQSTANKPVEKEVAKIVFFFTDGTFKEYRPE